MPEGPLGPAVGGWAWDAPSEDARLLVKLLLPLLVLQLLIVTLLAGAWLLICWHAAAVTTTADRLCLPLCAQLQHACLSRQLGRWRRACQRGPWGLQWGRHIHVRIVLMGTVKPTSLGRWTAAALGKLTVAPSSLHGCHPLKPPHLSRRRRQQGRAGRWDPGDLQQGGPSDARQFSRQGHDKSLQACAVLSCLRQHLLQCLWAGTARGCGGQLLNTFRSCILAGFTCNAGGASWASSARGTSGTLWPGRASRAGCPCNHW